MSNCILCIVSELVNGGWSDSSGNGCAQDYYYFCLMQDKVTGVEEQPQVAASLQGRPPYRVSLTTTHTHQHVTAPAESPGTRV